MMRPVYRFSLLLLFCLSGVLGAKKKMGELKVEVLSESKDGCASGQAANGDRLTAHYTGTLQSTGVVFDTSRRDGREPFSFTLGKKQVIKGFEEGFLGMCVGETRRLTIPSHLGYGDKGHPPAIPPAATLIFEVELMSLDKVSAMSFIDTSKIGGALLPVAVILAVVYFIYDRAQQETAAKKSKSGKGASTKKRR